MDTWEREYEFWNRSEEDILSESRDKIERFILRYHERLKIDEVGEIKKLKLAANFTFDLSNIATFAQIDNRLAALEKANTTTVCQALIDISLSILAGGIVSKVAQLTLYKILKNRLLKATVKQKIKLEKSSSTRNFIELNKRHIKKSKEKYKYFKITLTSKKIIDDDSWAHRMFKTVPELLGDITSETIKDVNRQNGSSNKTPKEYILEIFDGIQGQLDKEITQAEQDYSNFEKIDVHELMSNESELLEKLIEIKEMIQIEKDNLLFENSLVGNDTLEDNKIKILRQPYLIGLLKMILGESEIPKIAPFVKAREEFVDDIVGTSVRKIPATPEKVNLNKNEKILLDVFSRHILVPKLNTKKKFYPITFDEKYPKDKRDPDRKYIKMIHYIYRDNIKSVLNGFFYTIEMIFKKLNVSQG